MMRPEALQDQPLEVRQKAWRQASRWSPWHALATLPAIVGGIDRLEQASGPLVIAIWAIVVMVSFILAPFASIWCDRMMRAAHQMLGVAPKSERFVALAMWSAPLTWLLFPLSDLIGLLPNEQTQMLSGWALGISFFALFLGPLMTILFWNLAQSTQEPSMPKGPPGGTEADQGAQSTTSWFRKPKQA